MVVIGPYEFEYNIHCNNEQYLQLLKEKIIIDDSAFSQHRSSNTKTGAGYQSHAEGFDVVLRLEGTVGNDLTKTNTSLVDLATGFNYKG